MIQEYMGSLKLTEILEKTRVFLAIFQVNTYIIA